MYSHYEQCLSIRQSKPLAFYSDKPQSVLGLYLTNQCNFKCSHCCTNSSPEQMSTLDISKVIHAIDNGELPQTVRMLHVSGGEPFLRSKHLKMIGRSALKSGLGFVVNTNGFWATNRINAHRLLASLPGISQLILSMDKYHLEFQPIERIVHAVETGIEIGLHIQLAICTPSGVKTPLVDEFLAMLNKEARSKVVVTLMPIELGGRADALPEARWRPLSTELPEGSCWLLNHPTILEDGTIMACCNTVIRDKLKNTPLMLGRLGKKPVFNLLQLGAKDKIIRALRVFGPAFLARQLPRRLAVGLDNPMPSGDRCSLCIRIMKSPERVQVLRKILTKPKLEAMLTVAEKCKWRSEI